MIEGQLVAIFIANRKRAEPQQVEEAEAVVGLRLRDDRYFLQQGTFTKARSPDREVTLIEIEAVERLRRDKGIALSPGQARRNLITRGVRLNDLVGQEFAVGEVMLRGLRLCEPCDHLEALTLSGVHSGLRHQGGLRAQIIQGGILRTGDLIRPTNEQQNEVRPG